MTQHVLHGEWLTVCSALVFHRYHCAFGPEDSRNQAVDVLALSQRAANGGRVSAKQKGLGQRRGCLCTFRAKQFYRDESVLQLSYFKHQHCDNSGLPCHGSSDPTAECTKARGAPRLSEEKKEWVRSRLRVGAGHDQILTEHEQMVRDKCRAGGEAHLSTDDRGFSAKDIDNIAAELETLTWRLHADDAESVRLWTVQNPELVVWYQQGADVVGAPRQPFTLLVQTPWQLEQLVKHGHGSVLCMDATFGTNKWKVILSLVVLILSDSDCGF